MPLVQSLSGMGYIASSLSRAALSVACVGSTVWLPSWIYRPACTHPFKKSCSRTFRSSDHHGKTRGRSTFRTRYSRYSKISFYLIAAWLGTQIQWWSSSYRPSLASSRLICQRLFIKVTSPIRSMTSILIPRSGSLGRVFYAWKNSPIPKPNFCKLFSGTKLTRSDIKMSENDRHGVLRLKRSKMDMRKVESYMATSGRKKLASRFASKRKSGSAATRLFKDNRSRKRRSKRDRGVMGAEK